MSQEQVLISQGAVFELLDLSQSFYRWVCSREGGKIPRLPAGHFLLMGNSPSVPGKEGEMCLMCGDIQALPPRAWSGEQSQALLEQSQALKNVIPCSQLESSRHSGLDLMGEPSTLGKSWPKAGQLPMDTETCTGVEGSYNTHHLPYKHIQTHPSLIPPRFNQVHGP